MNEVKSSAIVSRGRGNEDPTRYNVELQRLQRIDLLAQSTWPLTDLRDEEIVAFGIYRSLDTGFRYPVVSPNGDIQFCGGLPLTLSLIENIRDMRPSRGRMGRKELIEAIGKGRPLMPYEIPPMYEADKEVKPGILDRLMFWRKR